MNDEGRRTRGEGRVTKDEGRGTKDEGMAEDPVLEQWHAWAAGEAKRRELSEMASGLELLAKAASRLRAASWAPDASRPEATKSADDGHY